jgi:hypothetical protein
MQHAVFTVCPLLVNSELSHADRPCNPEQILCLAVSVDPPASCMPKDTSAPEEISPGAMMRVEQ